MTSSKRTNIIVTLFASFTLVACGGSEDPFSTDGGNSADAASAVDSSTASNPDGRVNDASTLTCAPMPSRFIVLGDSITACAGVGGKNGANCSAKMVHDYLKANVNPDITYENFSVNGAVTEDVPNNQIGNVPVESGHALVMIFVGGNDLQPYIFISDDAAETRFAGDEPRIATEWNRIYSWLENSANFPDGVTLMMSAQYNPFDDCTASPYNLSPYKTALLKQFNETLTKQSNAREYSVITDQHGPFLGHGHHNAIEACPHYSAGSEGWMEDLIHPNAAGHANLAVQWQATSDLIYSTCN